MNAVLGSTGANMSFPDRIRFAVNAPVPLEGGGVEQGTYFPESLHGDTLLTGFRPDYPEADISVSNDAGALAASFGRIHLGAYSAAISAYSDYGLGVWIETLRRRLSAENTVHIDFGHCVPAWMRDKLDGSRCQVCSSSMCAVFRASVFGLRESAAALSGRQMPQVTELQKLWSSGTQHGEAHLGVAVVAWQTVINEVSNDPKLAILVLGGRIRDLANSVLFQRIHKACGIAIWPGPQDLTAVS